VKSAHAAADEVTVPFDLMILISPNPFQTPAAVLRIKTLLQDKPDMVSDC